MGQTRRRLLRRMQGAHSIHGGLGRARDHPHPPTHTPSLHPPGSGFMSGASCSGWRLPQQQLSPIWLYFLPSGMMGQKCLDLQADGSNPSCTAARIHVASDEPPNSPRLRFFLCALHLPWRARGRSGNAAAVGTCSRIPGRRSRPGHCLRHLVRSPSLRASVFSSIKRVQS